MRGNTSPDGGRNRTATGSETYGKSTRRGALRTFGAAGLGIAAIGSVAEITTAGPSTDDVISGDGGGGDPPYYKYQRKTYSPDDHSSGDCMTVDLTTTVKYLDPRYDSFLGTDVTPFQVDLEGALYYNDDCSLDGFVEELYSAGLSIQYPDNEVYAGTSNNWIGGMAEYDDPDDADAGDYAVEVIDFALDLVPYAGDVKGAIETGYDLARLGTRSASTDKKTRDWDFNPGAGRINVWSRFKAETGEGEGYDIDISSEVTGTLGIENNFSVFLSN